MIYGENSKQSCNLEKTWHFKRAGIERSNETPHMQQQEFCLPGVTENVTAVCTLLVFSEYSRCLSMPVNYFNIYFLTLFLTYKKWKGSP